MLRKDMIKLLVLLLLVSPLLLMSQDEKKIDKYSKMSLDELMEVEIYTASKNRQKVSDAPGIVTVITAEEIKNTGARDLRDVLRNVPGFEIGIRELGYTEIGIRGIITPNSEKVKILIDDVPINEILEGSGTVVFADLSLENVKAIEIVRGPGSALYGTNAFVGVINIITKKAEDIDGSKMFLRAGSFNTWEAGFLFGRTFKKCGLDVTGYFNFLDTDGPRRAVEADVLSNNPLNDGVSLAGTPSGTTRADRQKITAALNIDYKDLYFKGYFIDSKKKHYTTYSHCLVTDSRPHPTQLQGMLGYKFKPFENFEIEPRVYSLYYKVDNLWNLGPPGFSEINDETGELDVYTYGKYEINPATQFTLGADIKMSYDISPKNNVICGISYKSSKFTSKTILNNFDNPGSGLDNMQPGPYIMLTNPIVRKIYSAFIQDQWHISNSLGITAGVRWDEYSDIGSTVNPRFALVWNPFKKTTIKLLYGQAFRDPTFSETYLWAGGGQLRGSVGTDPETIRTAEMEFSQAFSKKCHFRINYFYTSIHDLILQKPFPGASYTQYQNISDEITVQGVEAEVKAKFGNGHYGFANYAYQYGKNQKTDEVVSGMANHFINAGVNLELSKYINFNITTNYVGPRRRAAGDTRARVKGYTLVNVNIIGKKIVKNMELVVSVHNLLDSDHRFPSLSSDFPNDYPLENRSFLIGLNYEFRR